MLRRSSSTRSVPPGNDHLRHAQAVCHETVSQPAFNMLISGAALIRRLLPTVERPTVIAAVEVGHMKELELANDLGDRSPSR